MQEKEVYIEGNHLIVDNTRFPLGVTLQELIVFNQTENDFIIVKDFTNYWNSIEFNGLSYADKVGAIEKSDKKIGKYTVSDGLKAFHVFYNDEFDEENTMIFLQNTIPDYNVNVVQMLLANVRSHLNVSNKNISEISRLQREQKELREIGNAYDVQEKLNDINKKLNTYELMFIKIRKIIEAEISLNTYLNDLSLISSTQKPKIK